MIKISSISGNKAKIQFNRLSWSYIGAQQGWMSTILSSIRDKQDSIVRLAQTGEVDDAQIEQAIRNNVQIAYGKGFILRDNDVVLDEMAAQQSVEDAFVNLAQREESFKEKIKAYVRANRQFSLGVFMSTEGKKKYLVPTFDGVGVSEFKAVFTFAMPHEIGLPPKEKEFNVGEIDIKSVASAAEIVELFSAAGYVASHAVVEIGSIGSRSTNWDTSYNLHIDGLGADMLQKVLTWFTDIENKDVRNMMKSQKSGSFDLTMFKEVNNLMSRLGMGEAFVEKVREVKDFEEQKGLKQQYRRERRIEDYKNKTLTLDIRLEDHKEVIFSALLKKATQYPVYVEVLQNSKITDPQEFLSFSFTMGLQGNIVAGKDAQDVVDMASAA